MGLPQRQQDDWDALARFDSLGSILTSFGAAGRTDTDEFFSHGEVEVAFVLGVCERLELALTYGRVLDFGCGIGRVSRAWATRAGECWGVDISEEMLRQARSHNARVQNLKFAKNSESLDMFPDSFFDVVYSSRVLQHIPAADAVRRYLEEMVRVLARDGMLIFQLPRRIPLKNRLQPRARIYRLLRALGAPSKVLLRVGLSPMRMAALSRGDVIATLARAGAAVIHEEPLASSGTLYFVRRDQ